MTAIELKEVWFKYETSNKWALRGVSISFKEGRVYAIVGPNGSGKTTLLKVASLLYKPTRGTIMAWGEDVWRLGNVSKHRKRVVYVHDKPILLRGSTLDNLALGLVLRGLSRREAYARAYRLLKELGLAWIAEKPARSLSSGEAHLVSILRALLLEPRMVMLDEPFAHLDVTKRRLLFRVLKDRLEEGMGIVLASHDYLSIRLADEIVLMDNGVVKGVYDSNEFSEID